MVLSAEPPRNYKSLTIEELIGIEVTSPTRTRQPFARSASALTLLTEEEIRRSGAIRLPDVLRYAHGLHVTRASDSSYAISARGFNTLIGNKLQVMRDGRSLYTPLLSGVFWETQDFILDDLDRIEVIRGPGATMWGPNAVNGVINIISKSAKDTQGTWIMGGGGTEERAFGGVRYGGRLGSNTYYRVYGKYIRRDEQVLANGSGADDESDHLQGGFRIDSELSTDTLLTFQGDLYGNEYGASGNDDSTSNGQNFLARWTRRFADDSNMQVQFFYDRTDRDLAGQYSEVRDTYDLDFQHLFPVGERNHLLWGLNYRISTDETGQKEPFRFDPDNRTIHLISGFIQDELTVIPELLGFIIGSKFEHNEFTGFEVQPTFRFALTPTRRHTIWGAISRAVRTPTRADDDLRLVQDPAGDIVLIRGDRSFRSEELIAYELGYRAHLHPRFSIDLATFYNDYDRLRSFEPTPPIGLPLVVDNKLRGQTYGAEFAVRYHVLDWWRLTAGYTYLETDLEFKSGSMDPTSAVLEGNDPRHILMFRSAMDLSADIQFDTMFRYVDSLPNPAVPSYAVIDLRVAWFPRPGLELSVVGQNLLDNAHPEQTPEAPQVEHGFYGKVVWRF